MARPSHAKHFSVSEALLPLLFFSGASLFYAAFLIPFMAGMTLLIFEILRRRPRSALSAVYLFWLAVCGGLGWFTAAIPPYWVWSVHLLVSESAWAPSEAQRAKPFLFGLKKYFKRRLLELAAALIFFIAFATILTLLRQNFHGGSYWTAAIFMILVAEIVLAIFRRRAK